MRLSYFVIPAIVGLVAVAGSLATGIGGPPAWYEAAVAPPGTPPSWVFGPVWTVLYALIAFSLIVAWERLPQGVVRRQVLWLYALNLLANGVWSFLFFRQQELALAVADAALISLSATALALLLWRESRTAALALVPYALWAAYATYLAAGYVIFS